MIKPILVYMAASALFLSGFFCCAFFANNRIKKANARVDFFERKWNELVEITSARTDQAKGDR